MFVLELPSGILERGLAHAVGYRSHEVLRIHRIALIGVVLGVMRERLVAPHIAVFVIAAGNDVVHASVQTLQTMAGPLPHLLTRLVEHIAVAHNILVLLDEVAREQYGLDVEVVHIVGNPRRTEFVERLVNVVLGVPLRVAEDDESKGLWVVELLGVSSVLRLCQEAREAEQGCRKQSVHICRLE